ncbi:MAG: tetratricopeptide repeat protein, partial [Anaerolineales bacterium]|nr:tetratricopeptide repeat protein [Anaerolineales bacterium]
LGVHGLFDDPVFAAGGALPFLFVWAGLAALLSRSAVEAPGPARLTRRGRGWAPAFGAVGLVLLVATFLARDLLTANWHVNRAVNALAAQEIATWPAITPVGDPAPALAELEAALQADPDQVSARFRRGLLALNAGDYAAARADLEQAFAVAPESRAVLKALGYARLWSGDVDGAARLLGRLPEIPEELNAFAFFWESQSQPALSQNARALAAQLTP